MIDCERVVMTHTLYQVGLELRELSASASASASQVLCNHHHLAGIFCLN